MFRIFVDFIQTEERTIGQAALPTLDQLLQKIAGHPVLIDGSLESRKEEIGDGDVYKVRVGM